MPSNCSSNTPNWKRIAPWRSGDFRRVLLLSTLLISAHVGHQTCWAASTFGKVSKLTGSAKVQRGASGPWLSVSNGMTVYCGDRAVTGDNCRMEITMTIGGILRVEENSQVDFEEKSGGVVGLQVWLGRVWSSIKKVVTPTSKFEVSTPSAVAAVRGTEFFVDVDGVANEGMSEEEGGMEEQGTHIGVLEGEVVVTDLAEEMSAREEEGEKVATPETTPYSLNVGPNESITVGNSRMLERRLNRSIETVAVLPFRIALQPARYPGLGSNAGEILASYFARSLEKSARGRFKVVPPPEARKRLEALKAPTRDYFHSHAFAALARQAGWDAVILGGIKDNQLPRKLSEGADDSSARGRDTGIAASEGRKSRGSSPNAFGFGGKPDPRRGGGKPSPSTRQGPEASRQGRGDLFLGVQCVLSDSGANLLSRRIRLSPEKRGNKAAFQSTVERLAETIARSMPQVLPVLQVDRDRITLKGGADRGIKVGETRMLIKQGARWMDPSTNRPMGNKMAGMIAITEVQKDRCVARWMKKNPTMEAQPGDMAVPRLAAKGRGILKPRLFDRQWIERDGWLRWNQEQGGYR
ncbi:MAG: FecR domain-containing protein [Armatimonadetes bacterium]|nr:FecR domain-containing protein [Armatimonadota bacterium]